MLDDELAADTETDTPNTVDFPADMADVYPADRAIDSNHNHFPTTNRHRLESRPTGNIDSATGRPRQFAALV